MNWEKIMFRSRGLRGVFLALGFLSLWSALRLEAESVAELSGGLQVVERFLVAGKQGNALHGARLLDVYESSPRKTERDIELFFKKKRSLFSDFVSVGDDLYGYEYVEKGHKGPNLSIEGRVETVGERRVEFSARLVLRGGRWRILSFELD